MKSIFSGLIVCFCSFNQLLPDLFGPLYRLLLCLFIEIHCRSGERKSTDLTCSVIICNKVCSSSSSHSTYIMLQKRAPLHLWQYSAPLLPWSLSSILSMIEPTPFILSVTFQSQLSTWRISFTLTYSPRLAW